LNKQIEAILDTGDSAFKKGFENIKYSSLKALNAVWERLGTSLFKIGETPVTTLGLLRVFIIISLAWMLSHFVRRGLVHLSTRQQGSTAFLYTLGRLAHYLILIIGISIGLSSIGVNLSNFAMIAGALSLGIGFGLQAIVSNFVSGLIVLFERSLRIGDFVELASGLAGEVRAINVRSTLVTTPDMVDILVPNSEFVNGKVTNWTLTDASRRIHIPFGIAYGTDKEIVRKAALEAAEQTSYTLMGLPGREPEVWLANFGDSSLDFELVVWVKPQAVKKPQRVRAAYYWELETALRKYGIEIPFPQRDLHIRSSNKDNPTTAELPPLTEKED
jgi:potassium efflux system protein